MPKTTIVGDVFSYNKAVEFIIAHASKTGLNTPIVTKIKLFCQEIILNIIRHAYDSKSGDIEIDCRIKDQDFIIQITDYGMPYNSLSQKKLTDKTSSATQTQISDFAKLMKDCVDSAEYTKVGFKNIVTLVKKI
jgi:serine/threonine-protein kinase RsbW